MQLPTWWQLNGGFQYMRHCHKKGGQWAAGRAYGHLQYCRLVYLSIHPHYRRSTGSQLLGGNTSNAFSTSTVACRLAASSADAMNRTARKKARVKAAPTTTSRTSQKTKVVEEIEQFLRPKPKLRMVGSPETKPESDVTTSNAKSPLNAAWEKHDELTRMFYKKVEEEDNIFWIESKKLDKVPRNKMAKWHCTPRSNRTGLMRVHSTISHVTAYIEDQELRKSLTDWDANSCHHLAPYFKEILEMRARLVKSYGFNNYMDYKAQYKMLDRRSVGNFLNHLKQHFSPLIAAHMDELFEMKLRDMGYHLPFETLRTDLRYYNHTILNFQDAHAKYRLDVGEVARYAWLKDKQDGALISSNYLEYFPLQSTTRKLLHIIPPVFGVKFEELLPDEKKYITISSDYLNSGSSSKITDKEEKLLIFAVKDTRFRQSERPLGFLVLDLLQRPGKIHHGRCTRFYDYQYRGETSRSRTTPGLVILANIPRPTTQKPSFLSHSNLEILAHELGHAVHHFVRGDLRGVPRDSIEIPSHVFEKWVADPQILEKLSSHYAYDGEAYMRAWNSKNSSKRNNIFTYQFELWKAKFDLQIHSYSENEVKNANLGYECGKILGEWAGIFGDATEREKYKSKDIGRRWSLSSILSRWIGNGPWIYNFGNDESKNKDRNNNTYLNWTELQGYATSNYCYLYAEVYTVDIFNTFFKRDPLNRKQGLRFRKMFLEHRDYFPNRRAALRYKRDPFKRLCLYMKLKLQGRSENTMDALEKFMGWKLSMKPFLKSFKAPMNKEEARKTLRMRLKVMWESIRSQGKA